jgi:hypothetical protein
MVSGGLSPSRGHIAFIIASCPWRRIDLDQIDATQKDNFSAENAMDRFIARENIKHFRRELENGVHEPTRAAMLRLLVEEENHLGLTREQLVKLDHHISRLSEIMARHVDLMDNLKSIGQSSDRASMVLATLNDLMAVYIAHRQKIKATLADGKARVG